MTINLPYPIGTKVECVEDGVRHIDIVAQYIIENNNNNVSVVLNYGDRWSTPIDIYKFMSRWSIVK